MTTKLLSVIIPNYNGDQYLAQALDSLIVQRKPQLEIIVIDGESDDGSIEIVNSYLDDIDIFICEKDSGQSEAFNKGCHLANGQYLFWLNSDDILLPGTIDRMLYLIEHKNISWASGNFLRFSDSNGILGVYYGLSEYFSKFLQIGMPHGVCGPSSLFKKELFLKTEGFDEQLSYVMDIDLWAKFKLLNVSLYRDNVFWFAFRHHELSKTASSHEANLNSSAIAKEKNLLIKKYNLNSYVGLLRWYIFRVLDGSLFRTWIYSNKFKGQSLNDFFE